MGKELGAGLEASGMDGKLGLALGRELGAGLEAPGWVLDGMSGAGKKWLLYLELVFESLRQIRKQIVWFFG